MMRAWRNALGVCLALAVAMPVAAQSPGEATARGMAATLVDGMALGAELSGRGPAWMRTFTVCMEDGASTVLVPLLQQMLGEAFTAQELATLDAHFASPLAALSRRHSVQVLREQSGGTGGEPVVITAEERAAIEAFDASPLGVRVWSVGSEDGQPGARLQAASMTVLAGCMD